MTPDHDRYEEWAAAYTLGALEPDDRRAFEQHAADCDRCAAELTALAPLPGLIAKVDPDALDHRPDPAVADRIAAAAGREIAATDRRVRRWRLASVGLGLVAASLVAVLVVGVVDDASDEVPAQAAAVVSSDATTADVSVRARPWGTEIVLDITGLPSRSSYRLWTVDGAGVWVQAATWSPTPTGIARLTGASSSPTDEVDRIVITSDDRDDLVVEATL